MFRKKKIIKAIAFFLLLNMLNYTFGPTLSYALTAGPTAPEYTSFEPVDATDMVNMSTGDFIYNIPLLEVPGPGGGYPLSLSYHAGIQPEEEASWVGLGWTLNPGAINRSVNGFPDDYYNVDAVDRSFWSGGKRKNKRYGVTVGLGDYVGVTVGLSVSNDTYQGNASGMYLGLKLGYELSNETKVGVGVEAGGDRISGNYNSAYAGVSQSIVGGVSSNVGVSMTNTSSGSNFGFSGSISAAGLVGTNISLRSGSVSTNYSVGGATSTTHNSNVGKISTSSTSMSIGIPIYIFSLNYSRTNTRYWMDEIDELHVSGSLYTNTQSNRSFEAEQPDDFYNHAFDVYDMYEEGSTLTQGSETEKMLGGTFPNYDDYFVTAQGLGGKMKPYFYKSRLFRQSKIDKDDKILTSEYVTEGLPYDNDRAEFRFINDFSNTMTYDPRQVQDGTSTDPLNYDFNDFSYPLADDAGYGGGNKLPGSNHVEWFTNKDITHKSVGAAEPPAFEKGFLETTSTGLVRRDDDDRSSSISQLIGGYMITNPSGVTYHYALPVYAFDEYQHQENKLDAQDDEGKKYNSLFKGEKYPYTWLLTTVTGPDYVDRNEDNIANDGDWGYWVNFEYGKWSDNYLWRNPGEGYDDDIDDNFRSFSTGKKELYYLDKIETATHKALFIKKLREDGLSAIGPGDVGWQLEKEYLVPHKWPSVDDINNADARHNVSGFQPKVINTKGYVYNHITSSNEILYTSDSKECCYDYYDYPTDANYGGVCVYDIELSLNPMKLLALDEIILLDKQTSILSQVDKNTNKQWNKQEDETSTKYTPWEIMRPECDVNSSAFDDDPTLFHNLLINNYSGANVLDINDISDIKADLHNEALRVIKFNHDYSLCPGTPNSTAAGGGKLTLNSLDINGKKNQNIIPPLQFSYQSPDTPYDKEKIDWWGMYKADYDSDIGDANYRKLPDPNTDNADWSLNEITTSLGSKIKVQYEADTYNDVIVSQPKQIKITNIVHDPNNANQVLIYCDDVQQKGLQNIFEIGDEVEMLVAFYYPFMDYIESEDIPCNPYIPEKVSMDYEVRRISSVIESFQTSGGVTVSFQIEDQELYDLFDEKKQSFSFMDPEDYDLREDKLDICLAGPISRDVFNPEYLNGIILEPGKYGEIGGGIRVAEIGIEDINSTLTSKYNYEEQDDVSSGYVSFEPVKFVDAGIDLEESYLPQVDEDKINELVKDYNIRIRNSYENFLSKSMHLPTPNVFYTRVTVHDEVQRSGSSSNQRSGYTVYEFNGYEDFMIDKRTIHDREEGAFENNTYGDFTYTSNPGYPKKRGWTPGETVDFSLQYNKVHKRTLALNKMLGAIGMPKRTTQYDKNWDKVLQTTYSYLHDDISGLPDDQKFTEYRSLLDAYNHQGHIEETFVNARLVEAEGQNKYDILGVVTKLEEYPTIQLGQKTTNFRTGITTEQRNLEYDFFNGSATKVLTINGEGDRYIQKIIPAYRIYPGKGSDEANPYAGMGLKTVNASNDHMLSQGAATYVYKVDSENDYIGLVSASTQTWSDQTTIVEAPVNIQEGIWRKKSSYSWIGESGNVMNEDGTYRIDIFVPFQGWDEDNVYPQWQKNSEITKYDYNSHALEAKDLNSDFAATKMSVDQSKVFASISNASYGEFAYSGAEDYAVDPDNFGGGVSKGTATVYSTNDGYTPHSGEYVLSTSSGNKAFIYTTDQLKDRIYYASVWTNSPDGKIYYNIDGGTDQYIEVDVNKKAGDWYLISGNITGIADGSSIEVGVTNDTGTEVLFDDFRFHPIDANMTSYAYNKWGELSAILDNDNMATFYEHDAMGRLESIYKETFKYGKVKVSEQEIKYARNQN